MHDPGFKLVRDFMITNPICAELWQPLSFIRQNMLVNAFSYLPVKVSQNGDHCWKVVSDRALAAYIRDSLPQEQRVRLAQTLSNAVENGHLELEVVDVKDGQTPLSEVIKRVSHLPILVSNGSTSNLTGILTAHDLL